jgi:hypothetical protein
MFKKGRFVSANRPCSKQKSPPLGKSKRGFYDIGFYSFTIYPPYGRTCYLLLNWAFVKTPVHSRSECREVSRQQTAMPQKPPNRTAINASPNKKPSPGKVRARVGLGGSDVGGLLARIRPTIYPPYGRKANPPYGFALVF